MLPITFLLFFQAGQLREGLTALQQGDLHGARIALESARAGQPNNPRVLAALAQTYSKLHEDKLALEAASRAETFATSDPPVFHGLSLYYERSGSLLKAAELESRYAQITPLDRAAMPQAMELYTRAGQPERAIEAARALPDWKSRADLHNLVGKAYAIQKDFGSAAAELHEAMRRDPYVESYAFDAANLQLRLEHFDAAIVLLEEGQKTFSTSPQLELALGVAYYGLRRFPDAITRFLKTIALAPDSEQPYIFLGRMLDQAGERLPEIEARFEEYERANPKSYLGYLLHAKGLRAAGIDATERIALLRKAVQLDDAQWEAHFEFGLALEATHDLPNAAKELKRAVELNPAEATPHYRLARVYDRLQQPALAAEERRIHQQLAAKTQAP